MSFILAGTRGLMAMLANERKKRNLSDIPRTFLDGICSNDWIGASFANERSIATYLECTRKMATYYMDGSINFRKDNAEIYTLVQVAAEKGIAEMQYLLGHLYLHDEAKQQRAFEAVLWWRKAAEQGYKDAINGLENLALDEAYADALTKKYD